MGCFCSSLQWSIKASLFDCPLSNCTFQDLQSGGRRKRKKRRRRRRNRRKKRRGKRKKYNQSRNEQKLKSIVLM